MALLESVGVGDILSILIDLATVVRHYMLEVVPFHGEPIVVSSHNFPDSRGPSA